MLRTGNKIRFNAAALIKSTNFYCETLFFTYLHYIHCMTLAVDNNNLFVNT